MEEELLASVPGARDLVEWFGRMPHFHDAELRSISLSSTGPSLLQIYAFNMTDKVDDKGFFILEKHAAVTVKLTDVTAIDLGDFDMQPGIIFGMEFSKVDGEFRISWDSSYGVSGAIRAKLISVSIQPGKPTAY